MGVALMVDFWEDLASAIRRAVPGGPYREDAIAAGLLRLAEIAQSQEIDRESAILLAKRAARSELRRNRIFSARILPATTTERRHRAPVRTTVDLSVLTSSQAQIAEYLRYGYTVEEIARIRGTSRRAVYRIIGRLRKKISP